MFEGWYSVNELAVVKGPGVASSKIWMFLLKFKPQGIFCKTEYLIPAMP